MLSAGSCLTLNLEKVSLLTLTLKTVVGIYLTRILTDETRPVYDGRS